MNAGGDDGYDLIGLREIVRALWSKRLWVIACTSVLAVVAGAVAMTMTPIYSASTILASASTERGNVGSLGSALSQLGGLASLAGLGGGGGAADIEETLAVLRSRQLLESFVVDNNVMPILFSNRWDANLNKWRTNRDQPTLGDAYRYFSKTIMTIDFDRKTGLVTLRVNWRDRTLAAFWANALVRKLNSAMRARARIKADESIKYLESELGESSILSTRDAISRLIEAQVKQRMLANVSEDYALRVVDPAAVPELNEMVSPRKFLMVVIGALTGFLLSGLVVTLLITRVVATMRKGA